MGNLQHINIQKWERNFTKGKKNKFNSDEKSMAKQIFEGLAKVFRYFYALFLRLYLMCVNRLIQPTIQWFFRQSIGTGRKKLETDINNFN